MITPYKVSKKNHSGITKYVVEKMLHRVRYRIIDSTNEANAHACADQCNELAAKGLLPEEVCAEIKKQREQKIEANRQSISLYKTSTGVNVYWRIAKNLKGKLYVFASMKSKSNAEKEFPVIQGLIELHGIPKAHEIYRKQRAK